MAAIQRSTIIRGPATVAFNSATFYTKSDITVTVEHTTFDVETSAFGKVDTRVSGRRATITFTPDGVLNAAKAAVLWPYGSTAYGASILGDLDCVVTPCNPTGTGSVGAWTFYNAAITSMPDLILSATKTLVGQVVITAIGKDAAEPSAANSLIKIDSVTAADAEFTTADIVTEPFTAAWGATITGIETRDGFTCTFGMNTQDVATDSQGVRDLLLTGLEARVRCEPINITEANLVTALAVDKAPGTSLLSGNAFTVTSASAARVVVLADARPLSINPQWGLTALRDGTLEMVSLRKFSTGDPVALFAITMPA